jgi:hypothetical protein
VRTNPGTPHAAADRSVWASASALRTFRVNSSQAAIALSGTYTAGDWIEVFAHNKLTSDASITSTGSTVRMRSHHGIIEAHNRIQAKYDIELVTRPGYIIDAALVSLYGTVRILTH